MGSILEQNHLMVKGRNSEFSSENTKTLNLQISKVIDLFAIKSKPLFSLESRYRLPFSENSIMLRFRFIGNSNVPAKTGNAESGWDILAAEWF